MEGGDIKKINNIIYELKSELYKNVLPFWFDYSFDSENGGFFSCIDYVRGKHNFG